MRGGSAPDSSTGGPWRREARASLRLAYPLILTNLTQAGIQATDVVMLGWAGPRQLAAGARPYVAVAGGIDVPLYYGSRSTYTLVGIGGFEGRALAEGDELALGPDAVDPRAGRRVDDAERPEHPTTAELRLLVGLHSYRLTPDSLERFTDTTITTDAALAEEVAEVRLRGYATCRGEYEPSAWGVSAPVVDTGGRLVAVLSIWGPGTRVTADRFEVLGSLVHSTAATLLDR